MRDGARLTAAEAAGVPCAKGVIDHGTAVDWFLCDMAHAAGFFGAQPKRPRESSWIARLPLLTAPNSWYFAGLVAREASVISSLFGPRDAGPLLKDVFGGCDAAIGRSDTAVSALIKRILGRVGLSSVICGAKVDDSRLSAVILALMSRMKGRTSLDAAGTIRRQVRAAFALNKGTPFWWREFRAICELPAKEWPQARAVPNIRTLGRSVPEQSFMPGRLLEIPAAWASGGRSLRQKSWQSLSPKR